MNTVDHLIVVCDAFCQAREISRATLSTRLFSRGTRIDQIATGKSDPGAQYLASRMQWLSDNWPANAEWPEGVARPAPKPAESAE